MVSVTLAGITLHHGWYSNTQTIQDDHVRNGSVETCDCAPLWRCMQAFGSEHAPECAAERSSLLRCMAHSKPSTS